MIVVVPVDLTLRVPGTTTTTAPEDAAGALPMLLALWMPLVLAYNASGSINGGGGRRLGIEGDGREIRVQLADARKALALRLLLPLLLLLLLLQLLLLFWRRSSLLWPCSCTLTRIAALGYLRFGVTVLVSSYC
ncbi:hypothetical protein C8J57DRAFT_1707242 [Mycena rebaudengoi]|nr:hypothetical protein C8J57DRAFT_1707242 [Mycena rebaudengoi]